MPARLIFLTVLLITLFSFRVFADDSGAVCLSDALRYDTRTETHFEGRVEAITNTRGLSSRDLCTFVTISKAGVRTTFYLGPQEFIERNHFKLNVGDMVSFTGASATDFRKRSMVLVRSIRNNSTLLVLRDEGGTALWMKLPVELDPEIVSDSLKECRVISNR
jgi:hypothetical protein